MVVWRLLDTAPRSAAENITLDEVLLEARARGTSPNTLRFLQFNPPAVLIGYHQTVAQEVRVDFCRAKGVEVNRRLTGGGAIYLDGGVLGWELIASKADLGPVGSRLDLYQKICEGVAGGLRDLGVEAAFRPRNDIEVRGRKISGTGGCERGGAFLFQGTLLVEFDPERMIRALRIPTIKLKDKELASARDRITTLNRELGRAIDQAEVRGALVEGFSRSLGVDFEEGSLILDERRGVEELLPVFRSPEWVNLVERPLDEAVEVQALRKTRGGLIRVALTLDVGMGVIKSALITGDFFSYPERAMLDLEARLKYTPLKGDEIRETVRDFFRGEGVEVLGVDAEDFVRCLLDAAAKGEYVKQGITPPEANGLNRVGRGAHRADYLLIPYCAKDPTCPYRGVEGCGRCGGCSVDDAYRIAEGRGLRVVTIQNFEHLMETLRGLRARGVEGYVGCCCSAFYAKHQDELEEAGVPGVLIDIEDETCYDLGRGVEALKGGFGGFTRLKIPLLEKILRPPR